MSTIRSRITGRPWQRPQRHVLGQLGDARDAREAVPSVDVHRVRSTHAFAARAAKRERIVLRLHLDERIEQHAIGVLELHVVVLHVRALVLVRVVAVDRDFHQ
jgi:hypothetical protein